MLLVLLYILIEVDGLYDGIDFSINMLRVKFEELNVDLFKKCLELVNKVLCDFNINKINVDEVVLVGGFIRILKI